MSDCAPSGAQLKILFPDVTIAKPKSSRNSSIEAFVVCRNYTPPPNFRPEALQGLLDRTTTAQVRHIKSAETFPSIQISNGVQQKLPILPRALDEYLNSDA